MEPLRLSLSSINEDELDAIFEAIDWFQTREPEDLPIEEVRTKVNTLFRHEFSLPHGVGSENTFYRVRKNDTDLRLFKDVDDVKYPPSTYTRSGRMNHTGQAIFYAANNEFTACAETYVDESDWFHITTYRPKTILNVRCIGDLTDLLEGRKLIIENESYDAAYVSILNSLPDRTKTAVCAIEEFIFTWMSSCGEKNYNVTAAIANEYMRLQHCDGLLYRSVKFENGINYAIKAEIYDQVISPENTMLCYSGEVTSNNSRAIWISNISSGITESNIHWPSEKIIQP